MWVVHKWGTQLKTIICEGSHWCGTPSPCSQKSAFWWIPLPPKCERNNWMPIESYFPVSGQNLQFCFYTWKYGSVFWSILRSVKKKTCHRMFDFKMKDFYELALWMFSFLSRKWVWLTLKIVVIKELRDRNII